MPDLFTLETPDVRVVWRRQRALKVPVPPAPTSQPFGLAASPADVWLNAEAEHHVFEQTEYTLLVESQTGLPLTVTHRDPLLLSGLTALDAGRRWLGPVNFGSQVGASTFVVQSGGRTVLTFDVEVFPTKLDYRTDFAALVAEVQQIEAGLAMAYVRATRHPARLHGRTRPAPLEWLWLLKTALDDLEAALTHVAAHPQRQLVPALDLVRAETIRRPDARLRQVIRRGGGAGPLHAGTPPLRARLRHQSPSPSLDTGAHRWLKHQLGEAHRRLVQLNRQATGTSPRAAHATGERQAMARRLYHLLALPPLAEATQGRLVTTPTPELLGAPGYREAYAACLRLTLGLDLAEGAHAFALKDLHRLYEYACYLLLLRALSEETGLPIPVADLVHVRGGQPTLKQGQRNAITFALEAGRRVRLAYNPRFAGRELLVPQKPDVLLTVVAPGEPPRRYVLDAKYRVDASPSYVRRFGMPGPPESALGTLHRYRDALRPSGDVMQAIALYPHRPVSASWQASRLWTHLFTSGVGAIPLLPDGERPLRTWLRSVLA